MSKFFKTSLAVVGSIFMVSSMYAQATIEEVIVTAQRTEQSLQDVPIAVSAFTEEMLTERQIEVASDIQLQVPGVAYSLNSLIYFGLFFIFGSLVYYRKNFLEDASKKFLVYFILFIIATVIIIPLRAKVSFTSGSELFNQDWSLFKIKTLENENGQWSFPVIDNIYNYSNFFVFDQNWHLFSFLRAFTTWYGIFFFIFLFKRFGDKKNKLWAYVSKSSYWVYLIHFPVQHLLYIFILRDNIKSSILLFFLLLLMSAVISFFSYNIFIRSTFVGKLLNGKLHNSERFKYNIDKKYFQKCITILIISFFSIE